MEMTNVGTAIQEVEQIVEEISKLDELLEEYLPTILSFGLRILLALIFAVAGARFIKVLRKIVKRSMERANVDLGVIQFIDSILKIALYFVLIMLIASSFGVDATSVIALVGSAGVAVGLALQGYLANIAGGVLILIIKPFKVGDYIVQGSLEGTVSEIQMVYTYLLTPDNRKVVIPNGKLANDSLINVTAQDKRRLDIEVGISYSADLKKAQKLCWDLLEREERILETEVRRVVVSELAESAVVLKLIFWVRPENYWDIKWELTEALKLTFDEHGIEIPFNQLDVTIKQN